MLWPHFIILFIDVGRMATLPGDLKTEQKLQQLIRVNNAGEYGAKYIYAGQMAVLKDEKEQKLLQHMAQQEEQHLNYFSQKMQQERVRPSFFLPIWRGIGYLLGAGTARLGKNSAMICTEAVEEVIDQHYQEQLHDLNLPKELADNIEKFRQEELEHHSIAKANMLNLNLGHKFLYQAIKFGCKISIAIAKKF
jgi:ubiquinone biosynthesis monooxygenase Coq7